MMLSIPPQLEQELETRARRRQMSTDDLVREALTWYLRLEADTVDELAAWQEIRDEALRLVEGSES